MSELLFYALQDADTAARRGLLCPRGAPVLMYDGAPRPMSWCAS
ncbi:hypothetical protein [Streptomyces sp. NPDC093984]